MTVVLVSASSCFLSGPRARPPSTEVVEHTPQRLARGEYLVEHVGTCLYCHSQHDWSRYTGPLIPGTEGGGGICLGPEHDVPGDICTQNITPHADGLGSWSDGEIMRAFREGVSRDGRALFPWMPYASYRAMSDEDARAVTAYLRTITPRAGKARPAKLFFPTNIFINLAADPLTGPVPEATNRGEYLTKLASCDYCHTKQPRGQREPGRDFAGGFSLTGPWGTVVTPNITPDKTGLGRFTRDEFISRMKSWESVDEQSAPRRPKSATIMPWKYYAGMTEEDLGAIYDFLMTQKPVENVVSPFGD